HGDRGAPQRTQGGHRPCVRVRIRTPVPVGPSARAHRSRQREGPASERSSTRDGHDRRNGLEEGQRGGRMTPWTVVLAAGAGRRLASVTGGVPKQFWRAAGGRSLLRQTLDRFAPLAPTSRTVVV